MTGTLSSLNVTKMALEQMEKGKTVWYNKLIKGLQSLKYVI